MPVPLMVRVDDDVAAQLRERSERTHAPMNRIINDALRAMFADEAGVAGASESQIVATFHERTKNAYAALQTLPHQEISKDYHANLHEALRLILDCAVAAMTAIDPASAPLISNTVKATSKQASGREVHA
jgi:predicted transcriptional regulator